MSYKGLSILAVVPARGGSKSIPEKNLRKVGGISLVGRAANAAASLDWITRRIISTDDEKILDEATAHGLDAPFMRPESLSGDSSSSIDMWQHAWTEAEDYYGMRFDISVLLEPTSPLRTPDDIRKTVEKLADEGHEAVVTVSEAPAHFTPEKCLTIDDASRIEFYLEGGEKYSIRQSIPSYYFRNGICYALKRETLIDKGYIFGKDTVGLIIERPVVNIDEPYELKIAEVLLEEQESRH